MMSNTQDAPWEDDPQYEDRLITKVTNIANGWEVSFDGLIGIWYPRDIGIHGGAKGADVVPHVGDIARLYGKGLGYTVRGLTIDGQLIYYQSEPPVVPVSDSTSHDCPPWAQIVREQPYREQRKKRLSHLRGEVSVAVEFGWGSAITDICWSEYAGCWIAGNDEYGTVVRFCPWCGLDLWSLRPPEPV